MFSQGLGTVNEVGYARQLEDWTATIIGVPRVFFFLY